MADSIGKPPLHLFDGFIPEFIRWLSLATTILLLFFSFVTSQEGAKSVLSLYIFLKFEYEKSINSPGEDLFYCVEV